MQGVHQVVDPGAGGEQIPAEQVFGGPQMGPDGVPAETEVAGGPLGIGVRVDPGAQGGVQIAAAGVLERGRNSRAQAWAGSVRNSSSRVGTGRPSRAPKPPSGCPPVRQKARSRAVRVRTSPRSRPRVASTRPRWWETVLRLMSSSRATADRGKVTASRVMSRVTLGVDPSGRSRARAQAPASVWGSRGTSGVRPRYAAIRSGAWRAAARACRACPYASAVAPSGYGLLMPSA
ncbi:hypothetical protein GCM10009575_066430 [Streptomyces rhizosphaericus]|uniref:Uncharacterized protein n=1 Tax=Streptomyces rhizosphaericus TaxID=114699 RepID=A0ABN1QRS3_9ACTN